MGFNLNENQMNNNIKRNISPEYIKQAKEIEQALKSGKNIDEAMKNFTPEQREAIKNIMSNQNAINKFMNSSAAQNLMRKLMGGNK